MSKSSARGPSTGGWSLPLTWIALVAAVVIAVVGGRSAVVASVAGMAGAVLAVYLYRALSGAGARPRYLVFRFESALALSRLQEPVKEALGATRIEHDFENVWEWLSGTSRDGSLRFNLSRRHWAAIPGVREMVHGRVECGRFGTMAAYEQRVGVALARHLERTITFGRVDPDDNTVFDEATTVFRPAAGRPVPGAPDDRSAVPCDQCGSLDVGTFVDDDRVQQRCGNCGASGLSTKFAPVSERLVGNWEAVVVDDAGRPVSTVARGPGPEIAAAVTAAAGQAKRVRLKPE